jgi:hypothetical protein
VESVRRQALDRLADGHQGIALETSSYPYITLPDILDRARTGRTTFYPDPGRPARSSKPGGASTDC